jgi:VanZ family protein
MQLKTLGKFMKTWYPVVVMMVIIFIMSSFAATDSDKQSGLIINALSTIFPGIDPDGIIVTIVRKSAHFTEYALLGFFAARALRIDKKSPWLSIVIAAIYATTDEIHQSFIPGRSCELRDVLIDTAGATFGASIYWLFNRKKIDK